MSLRAVAGAALLTVLVGCGSASPEAELAAQADAVTAAANARDAGALRSAARELADTVAAQSDDGELPTERASSLLALADELYEQADLVDPQVQARLRAEEQARAAEQEAAGDRAAREQAEQQAQADRAAREQAAKEQAAREQAAREQAQREQAEGDKADEDDKDRDKDREDDD